MTQPDYFNTTSQKDPILTVYRDKATHQNKKVMEFFEKNPYKLFTPEEVHRAVFNDKTPITSVRRSITVLEQAGRLVKTDEQRMSSFNRPAYCWKLKITEGQQKLF